MWLGAKDLKGSPVLPTASDRAVRKRIKAFDIDGKTRLSVQTGVGGHATAKNTAGKPAHTSTNLGIVRALRTLVESGGPGKVVLALLRPPSDMSG